ncbi:hypothetical protein AMTRI_Chr09g23160 [Amborella trichopoda]
MQTKNQVCLSYPFWSNVIMLACCLGRHAEAFRHLPLQATISLHNRVLVSSCPALLNRVLVSSRLSIHHPGSSFGVRVRITRTIHIHNPGSSKSMPFHMPRQE